MEGEFLQIVSVWNLYDHSHFRFAKYTVIYILTFILAALIGITSYPYLPAFTKTIIIFREDSDSPRVLSDGIRTRPLARQDPRGGLSRVEGEDQERTTAGGEWVREKRKDRVADKISRRGWSEARGATKKTATVDTYARWRVNYEDRQCFSMARVRTALRKVSRTQRDLIGPLNEIQTSPGRNLRARSTMARVSLSLFLYVYAYTRV